jgi:DNA-binding HxlR family transcriptional regulator
MSAEYDWMKQACPTRQVLDRVAEKWTMLIVLALNEGTMRHGQLRARIGGVTQKMLTQTLRGLERDGMVARKVYPSVPVTVEYCLTDMGRSLGEAVAVLRSWSYEHMTEIEVARSRFDSNALN